MTIDGFYVRRGDDLWPIYEVRDNTIRVITSRIGAPNHAYPIKDGLLPDTFVRAGDTLDEAREFAPSFYARAAKAAARPFGPAC